MLAPQQVTLMCEVCNCPENLHKVRQAYGAKSPRRRAPWRCADCYPLPRCKQCGRRMRPRDAPVATWPKTVAKALTDTCQDCYRRGWAVVDTTLSEDLSGVARRMAPTDVWEVLGVANTDR